MSEAHLDPRRRGKIGSSQVAALFGVSRWLTKLQLFAHFAEGYDLDKPEDERMAWGRRLQDDILDAVTEERGWLIEPNADNAWVDHPDLELRCGATVDAWVRHPELGLGVVECKNVDRDQWYERGWNDLAAPPDIELQLQHQLWVSQARWGVIAVLVGGSDLRLIPKGDLRRLLPEAAGDLEREIRAFWQDVAEKRRPDPLGTKADISCLTWLYRDVIKAPPLDRSGDAALAQALEDYEWATEKGRQIEAVREGAKAQILAALEHAGMAVGPGGVLVKLIRKTTPAHQRRESISTTIKVKRTIE